MSSRAAQSEWRYKTQRKWYPARSNRLARATATPINTRAGESDDLLRAMVDLSISSVAVLDESGAIRYASKAWKQQHGDNKIAESIRNTFQSPRAALQFHEKAKITLRDDIQQILAGKEKEFHRQYCYNSHTGQLPFSVHAARLNLNESAFRVVVTHDDIPRQEDSRTDDRWRKLLATTKIERKRAEEALKDLGGRLIAAQEAERRRVARELHDDLNQRLALISMELQQLEQKVPDSLRKKVQTIEEQAIEASTEIHRLSYRLHPSKLDHLGLPAALASLCREVTESSGVKVQFHQTGFPATINKDVTLCLFRIAQEGLRNCVKHSGAEFARVALTKTEQVVRLSVLDNGCGFVTSPQVMEKGLGFISMKERLHLLGGEIEIYSSPLRGTRIEVTVPLERKLQQTLETPNTDRPLKMLLEDL